MKTKYKWILPIVILGLGLACSILLIKFRRTVEPQPKEAVVPLVRAMEVSKQNYQFQIPSQGTVVPRTEITVIPEVNGRIISVAPSFATGGFFEAGETLVSIDPRDFELALVRARAELARSQVVLQREEAEASVAAKEWKELGEDRTPSALLLREPQLAEARAAVSSAQAAVEQSERDLARCHIKAPFAGRIREKHADVGQYITKGSPLARIYSVDFAEVRLPLPVDQLAFLDLPLDFRGEDKSAHHPIVHLRAQFAGREHEWAGRIIRTEGEINARNRMIHAVAQVENPYRRNCETNCAPFSVGMFVEAEIEGRIIHDAVVIPRIALRGNDQVLIVDPEKRLRFRNVKVHRADRSEVVIAGGLEPGEMICLSTLDVAVDGMRVRIHHEEPGKSKARAVKVSAASH